MNETILNGLLNLFAIFASSVRIEREQASRAVHSYLSSHFGVRSHKEYIELYNALRDMYDDSLYVIEQIKKRIKVRDVINTTYDFCTGSHVGPESLAVFFMGKDRELGA